ncbi:hypothetical protein AB0L57_01285 [Nocardia sp. NPDC052254]|uniref:hypothetical protein n=1 Tax=Nocardia sp. NPDC052254 TaxID=3155681 RepID=UPI00343C7D45
MRVLTQAVRLALAASAVVAGSIAVAGPANAVATPAEACGSNYHEIDHHDIPGARIHLLYNGTTNCVVTTNDNPGTKKYMLAGISSDKHPAAINDSGVFAYYAGPVRLDARGICIMWTGASGSITWVSPESQSHCG